MVSTILGKRTRSAADSGKNGTRCSPSSLTDNFFFTALSTALPRPKRQAASVEIYVDEKDNDVPVRQTRAKAAAPSENVAKSVSALSVRSPPPKHNGARRVSSEQIKTHFNTVKAVEPSTENVKLIEVNQPSTPRRRDALSKQIPTTPRHRVLVAGTAQTPRTPRNPSTPSQSTVYNLARQAFTRSNDPGKLVGREDERLELSNFVESCIESMAGGCTYVSGPPGTGKSAMVHEVTQAVEETTMVKKAYVNCMSMKSSKDLYATLIDTLCDGVEVMDGEEVQVLQGMFAPSRKSNTIYVITLDEVDHIMSLDLESMYKLFEWSLRPTSHLVLIGIANALDLTDRLLPRLKARNLKPNLLPFLPYTAPQIKTIITSKLQSLVPPTCTTPNFTPFLHPAAIELCSRRVAAQTGDLRKAFDIVRRAVDIIEAETRTKLQGQFASEPSTPSKPRVLGENPNLSSPQGPAISRRDGTVGNDMAKLTVETAPRASIGHLNKVTAAAFSNGASARLKTLNLQQKAALCALVALERRKRASASTSIMATPSKMAQAAPSVKQLYDVYTRLCKAENALQPLTAVEFGDVIGSLETLGLVAGVDGRTGSFTMAGTPTKRGRKAGFGAGVGSGEEKRVASCVGEKELDAAVIGGVAEGILRGILAGEGLE
jgi:cell division control protein 6